MHKNDFNLGMTAPHKASIAFFESRLATVNGKSVTMPTHPHDMTEMVTEALAKGWAWEYRAGAKARGETNIHFNANNLKGFQREMARAFDVGETDIGLVVTNHNVDYSIQTPYNCGSYTKEVNLSEFAFEKKDSENSKHGYGFVRVKDRYYGAAKIGGAWHSRDDARSNAGHSLAYWAGQHAAEAVETAYAFGCIMPDRHR